MVLNNMSFLQHKLIIFAIVPLAILILVVLNRKDVSPIEANQRKPTTTVTVQQHQASLSAAVILEHILSEDLQSLDSSLLHIVPELKRRGAHRCWHKHSTFLQHLLGVHNVLRLWGQSVVVGRMGLLHSAYSNSYVNLALFDPLSERPAMQSLVGMEAEELIYTFCIIDRQHVVVDTLIKHMKIPSMGITVPHLRHKNTSVYLSPDFLQKLAIFTMADIADQYFGWQDVLFDGNMLTPSSSVISNSHNPTALWPGISQPGLWLNFVSKLGIIAATYHNDDDATTTTTPLPPVFRNCTIVITEDHEVQARDLYWKVIMDSSTSSSMSTRHSSEEDDESATATTTTTTTTTIDILQECVTLNPWVFEPFVLLAQSYLHSNDFSSARAAVEKALHLQQMWGTAWDKRLGFPAWVAWTRVLHQRAMEKMPWPTNSWDVNNFGLVK